MRPLCLAAVLALIVSACAPLGDFDRGRGGGGPPLSIDEPIGPTTRGRLLRSTSDPMTCRAWLQASGVAFTPMADRSEGEFCRVTGAGAVRDLGQPPTRLAPARPMMTCELAAAVALWRRQSLEPAAREIFGAGVAQVDHMGVYACRRVNSAAEGRVSAHASAQAIDIAGVRLTNGRQISVVRDWTRDGSAEARYLRRIRDDACRIFGTTLSPDYNALHHNHLHLEAVGGRMCR
jgi:hypothetical protein